MKIGFSFLKEEIKNFYKKEFYFWGLSLLFLGVSLFFFLKEIKRYMALSESFKKIEESYLRNQPQIVRLKEALKKVNWQREFKKEELEFSAEVDLSDLKKAYTTLKNLSNSHEDTYFKVKEMRYELKSERELQAKPILSLKGIKIIYR